MAIGIIFVYLTPGYAPNLMSYLFGSIITVSTTDLWLMLALALAVTAVFILLYRPILYVAFDEQFARIRGIPVMFINYLLIILVALTIVLSIRTAGIILVLSVLTIPQNISNLFTNRFSHIMVGSVVLGFVASLLGLILSYYMDIPSGATIIFTLVVLYLVARLIKVLIFGR
jgi:zinc transport system permease protein